MRFNLSVTEMIVLGTAFAGILAWGLSIENRVNGIEDRVDGIEKSIERKVEVAVQAAVAPFATSVVPSGAAIAYIGEATAAPEGWEICGRGAGKIPSLEGRFLVGTHHIGSVGEPIGSRTHDHGVSIRSTPEREGRAIRAPDGADNKTGAKNWTHKHHVEGSTAEEAHIPPAIQVLFFCKQ